VPFSETAGVGLVVLVATSLTLETTVWLILSVNPAFALSSRTWLPVCVVSAFVFVAVDAGGFFTVVVPVSFALRDWAADFGTALEAVFVTAGFIAALTGCFVVLVLGAAGFFVAGLLTFLTAFVAGLTAAFMIFLI